MAGLTGAISLDTAAATYALFSFKKALTGVADAGLKFDSQMAQSSIGLKTALKGDQKAAQDLLKDLKEFNKVSPFEMQDIAPLAQKLLAMQIPAKELKLTLAGIGEQTAALGEGAATFQGISAAIGQINLKGQVYMEELRQLQERGVPAVQYLAKAWNVSADEMTKLISQGLIPGRQAVQALSEQMAANNFGAMAEQSLTLDGALSTLRDNFKGLAGEAMLDTYNSTTDVINRLNVLAGDKEVESYLRHLSDNFKSAFSTGVEAVHWFGNEQKAETAIFGKSLKLSSGELLKWVGFLWDSYKEGARAAAWFADTTTWLAQKGMGGAGDFFSANLEKGITGIEGKFAGVKKEIGDFAGSIGTAWDETWGSAPDWGKKWDEAGDKVAAARKKFGEGKAPLTHSFAGQFLGGDSDGKKARSAALKLQKDMLGDSARYYDMNAAQADKHAKAIADAAKSEIDALKGLRDSLRDVFGSIQSEFVALGVIDDPMGPMIKGFEKLIDIGGKSARIVANAGREWNFYAGKARDFRGMADGARSQQERISGQDGIIPRAMLGGGGVATGDKAGAKSLFEQYNIKSTVDMTCADVASRTIESLGISIKKSVNAGELERNVKAAGWVRVDPRAAPLGSAVFQYSASARSKTHAMMGLGDGTLASSSNHKTSYRAARGNERAYAPPTAGSGAATAGGKGPMPVLFSGGSNPLASTLRRDALKNGVGALDGSAFDASAISGSLRTIGAVDKAWGAAVKNTETNTARFMLQTRLASKDFQAQVADMASNTGKSVPQVIEWLRKLGNTADFQLSRVRAIDAANASLLQTTKATKEATKTESDRQTILREAAPLLTAAGLANGDYDRALEKSGRRFEVWNSDNIKGLLEQAKAFDKLGDKARAAGLRKSANVNAAALIGIGEKAANDAFDQGKIREYFQKTEEAAASLGARGSDAFKTLKGALKDSSLSAEDLRNVLKGIDPLLRDMPGISEKIGAVTAESLKRARAEWTSLTDESRAYQAQTKLVLQYGSDSPQLARELAMLEKRTELEAEYRTIKDADKKSAFNLEGKMGAFALNFDAGAQRNEAGLYRAAIGEATKAGQMFGDSSATAEIKWRTVWGDLSLMPRAWKTEMIGATAQVQAFADATGALDGARSKALDLGKELESSRASRRKALSPLQSQELDWKWDDEAARQKNPLGAIDQSAKNAIEAARNNVRALMRDMAKETRASGMAGQVSSAFDSMYDDVLSRQKSFGAAMREGLLSTLQQMAADVIKSQVRSMLTKLFIGAVSGGAGGAVAASGGGFTPGIASGLAASRGGLFGGAGDLGGGFSLGVHASGLDRVPRDNYLAVLHANESVLNAAEAESYRQNQQARLLANSGAASNGGGGSVTVNYVHNGNIVTDNPADYQRQMEARAQRGNQPRRANFEQARGARVALAGGRG